MESASSRRRIGRGILAIAGSALATLAVVYAIRWIRIGTTCSALESKQAVVDGLASQVKVFRPAGSSAGSCRETLSLYTRHSGSGLSCLAPCADKKLPGNARLCAEACVKNDEVLEAARRAAQKAKQETGREWIVGAVDAPTERATSKARLHSGPERGFEIDLPSGGVHAEGYWRFESLGTVDPVVVWIRVEPNDEHSFARTATLGEKTTRLSTVREKTEANRYLLARVAPSYEFSRDWLTATFRDHLVVQILWNLDEETRLECRLDLGVLDLEERHVDAGIAWAEKVCGSVRFAPK